MRLNNRFPIYVSVLGIGHGNKLLTELYNCHLTKVGTGSEQATEPQSAIAHSILPQCPRSAL